MAAPTTGVLSEDLTSNQNQQQDLTTEIDNFQTQLTAQKAQLDQVFSSVNATLEQYPFTLQEVNAALGALTSTSSITGTGSGTTTNTSTNTTPTSGQVVS